MLAEYTDKGAPLAEYYTAGDRVLARKMFGYHGRKEPGAPDLQTNGGLLYYTYDGLGNVSLLTDRLGESEASYRYDAFGGLLTSATAPYNLYGPFGKEFDPASGLIYFGARWYDASVGRFTTPDPAPGALRDPLTLNPYLFAKANPVNFVDRWGLHAEETEWVIDLDDETLGAIGNVSMKAWAGDMTQMSVREVSRSAEKLVLEYLWEHFHTYDVLHWLCQYVEDAAKNRYWIVIQEERYLTDWVPVESYERTEVIDLIAYKQDILVRKAGFAPPPPPVTPWFDVGRGGGEWILSAGVGFVPGLSEVKDVQEAITGVDLITGQRLTGWERVLTVVCIFVPLVGGSTVRGLLKGGEALTDTRLYRYTSDPPEEVLMHGFIPGRSGIVYTTPMGDLTPLQAQIDLALPPNRGLRKYVYEIDVSTLERMGVEVPEPTLVGRKYNMPGGALEVLFREELPAAAIRLWRRQ